MSVFSPLRRRLMVSSLCYTRPQSHALKYNSNL
jgi:hypothetical protein